MRIPSPIRKIPCLRRALNLRRAPSPRPTSLLCQRHRRLPRRRRPLRHRIRCRRPRRRPLPRPCRRRPLLRNSSRRRSRIPSTRLKRLPRQGQLHRRNRCLWQQRRIARTTRTTLSAIRCRRHLPRRRWLLNPSKRRTRIRLAPLRRPRRLLWPKQLSPLKPPLPTRQGQNPCNRQHGRRPGLLPLRSP
jgi:hypothetical protein